MHLLPSPMQMFYQTFLVFANLGFFPLQKMVYHYGFNLTYFSMSDIKHFFQKSFVFYFL